jgi:RNA polymerase sigma-70 factor, ECF subfamily
MSRWTGRKSVSGASVEEIEAIYRTRFTALVKVAAAILRDAETAVDIVQDAFAKAIRSRDGFRGDGPLEAWLWRIVLSQAQTRLQTAAPRPETRTGATENGASEPNDALRELVQRLPERQRQAIFLRYYADLDYAAIARVLGIKQGTVAATLNAAHAALRGQMQEVTS